MSRTKILTTFGTGPAREALAISLPLMARYAQRHGYRLVVPSDAEVERACCGRPASWGKIGWLKHLVEEDEWVESLILWLDADVVVVRHDTDIACDVAEEGRPFVSMTVQDTPDGAVPSCGVMLVNGCVRNALSNLAEIDRACGPDGMNAVRSSGWWEQAAMIRWLGGDPDQTPIVPPVPSEKWGTLSYGWNPHPYDPRGLPDDLRFFHATATNDRLGDMRRWAARAETQ